MFRNSVSQFSCNETLNEVSYLKAIGHIYIHYGLFQCALKFALASYPFKVSSEIKLLHFTKQTIWKNSNANIYL